MRRIRNFFNNLFSLLEDNKPSDEQKNVVVEQNPIPQSYSDNHQEVILEDLSPKDDITDSAIAEQVDIVMPSQDIEFAEIEPISIKEIPSSDKELVQEVDLPEGHFDKLLATTVDTIKYYDQIAEQVQNQDAKTLLNDVCAKLIENLVMSGCTPINEPTGIFDMTKHKTASFQIVPEDTTYTNLVRPGIEYNGEVKILAIVEL